MGMGWCAVSRARRTLQLSPFAMSMSTNRISLATLTPVEVRTFGTEEVQQGHLRVRGLRGENAAVAAAPPQLASPLHALSTCVAFASYPIAADVVHCHTWYSHFGGIVAKILYGLPLVITVHSLEPLRPWKRAQLGRARVEQHYSWGAVAQQTLALYRRLPRA